MGFLRDYQPTSQPLFTQSTSSFLLSLFLFFWFLYLPTPKIFLLIPSSCNSQIYSIRYAKGLSSYASLMFPLFLCCFTFHSPPPPLPNEGSVILNVSCIFLFILMNFLLLLYKREKERVKINYNWKYIKSIWCYICLWLF